NNTQKELISLLPKKPALNELVYNAIDPKFKPDDVMEARKDLGAILNASLFEGYILHVGGNTFYKNRDGVLHMYEQWRKISTIKLPLVMIGSPPTQSMLTLKEKSKYSEAIFFLTRVSDEVLVRAYQGAAVFVFPSLLEGFGFPIAEAMACGCPVITTNEAPMNEVGGSAAFYIPRYYPAAPIAHWASQAAGVLEEVLQLSDEEREVRIANGLVHCQMFQEDRVVDQIEKIYQKIVT
ncbi:MAG: glycosyltransferase, partial [Cellulophaga sp.]|nr:glycosyltransferase [Cellulophaga sp.]